MTMYGATKNAGGDGPGSPDSSDTIVQFPSTARVASSTDLYSLQEQQPHKILDKEQENNKLLEDRQTENENLYKNNTRESGRRQSVLSGGGGSVSSRRSRHASGFERSFEGQLEFEKSCVVLLAENSIEAQRINNNYKFGLRKWKSHVTSRPMDARSEVIQDLYSDISKIKDVKVRTLRPSNIIYTVLFGWWIGLLYGIIGTLMFVTVVGMPYANFCWSFASYFFWPFGKFVHQVKPYRASHSMKQLLGDSKPEKNQDSRPPDNCNEKASLVNKASDESIDTINGKISFSQNCYEFWSSKASWVWIIFGLVPLLLVHSIVFAVSWFFVISIPIAKVNGKMLTKILFLPPHEIMIKDTEVNIVTLDGSDSKNSEILMYTYQSVNFYYYKYTVDGVNIILNNSLIFVVLSIVTGYALDIEPIVKCVLGVLAIIPLTYYIGMAITSVAAQSSFAVGALLNATFGSAVEVILMIIMLKKGADTGKACYQELVKSSLTGAILCSILFIPGISMVVGGLKYPTQKFNPKSASISSALLFLAAIGVFSPTLLSLLHDQWNCKGCIVKGSKLGNHSGDFVCEQCEEMLVDPENSSLYRNHIRPLVYCVCLVLPFAYIIGVVFTMKTHTAHVFADFEKELEEETKNTSHGTAHWSRMKSVVILFMSAVCIALCGDLVSDNIQPLLESTGISEYFVGVTMLALVSELPEVVNGIQFALQNNVNLGIEIGCSTAVQVCLVQIPLLVLANIIHDMEFFLVFNYIHLVAVVFSVVVINYIFQDGKSDYFQGAIVVIIYILLMCIYLCMPTPDKVKCESQDSHSGSSSTITARPITILPFTFNTPPH